MKQREQALLFIKKACQQAASKPYSLKTIVSSLTFNQRLPCTSPKAVGPETLWTIFPPNRSVPGSLGRLLRSDVKNPPWPSPVFLRPFNPPLTIDQRLPCRGHTGSLIEGPSRRRREADAGVLLLYVKESFEVANEEGAKKAARYHID